MKDFHSFLEFLYHEKRTRDKSEKHSGHKNEQNEPKEAVDFANEIGDQLKVARPFCQMLIDFRWKRSAVRWKLIDEAFEHH